MSKRGIIRIFNLKTDRVCFVPSEDMESDIISTRFKLDLAMYPLASLQSEYASLGLELFTIEEERAAKEDENLEQLLKSVEAEYEAKGFSFYR
jgi:hypothetical protein